VVEFLCMQNNGAGAAGADCSADTDCQSGTCMPRSTDIAEPGYCLSMCRTADDCGGEGFTCERQVVNVESGAQSKVCRPETHCLPCEFDETAVCGGDFVCSQLRYRRRGLASTCLSSCAGLIDEETCTEGHTCQARIDGEGLAIEGEYVCTPDEPAETCAAAMPR
jgi:hypothetical protein